MPNYPIFPFASLPYFAASLAFSSLPHPFFLRLFVPAQSCKKITILDRKDRDLFIDLDLWHDLDQFIDLLKLILIFDL